MFASKQGFFSQSNGFSNSLLFNTNPASPEVNMFISTSGTTDLVNWMNSGGFTVEYWCYNTDWPAGYGGSANTTPGPGNHAQSTYNYWSFGPCDNGALQFYFYDGSAINRVSTANSALTLNTWQNICFVCTPSSPGNNVVSMYINGAIQSIRLNGTGSYVTSLTIPDGAIDATRLFSMGAYGASFLFGYYDNIRVSNIQRYSGSSYTVATKPFTVDSNTQLLINPTGPSGSSTIPYVTGSSSGTMSNSGNNVKISNTHYNHT